MMGYYDCSPLLQMLLQIVSQIAVIALIGSTVFSVVYRFKLAERITMAILLLVNVILHIVILLGGSTGMGAKIPSFAVNTPYLLLVLVIVASLVPAVWLIYHEIRGEKRITHTAIKESFDNLPTGVCFFNESGLPVLCNVAMQRFSFAVCGKDVQYITDLDIYMEGAQPTNGAHREADVFVLPDNRAWRLEKRVVTGKQGEKYTHFIALDVTELHQRRMELLRENKALRHVQHKLQELSANMVAVTREEEILAMKMRVHDEMGRCLLAARQALASQDPTLISDSLAASWQRAVHMLQTNNMDEGEDMLEELRSACRDIGLEIITRGSLPKDEKAAYLIVCAIRECSTNAVRCAAATELYVDLQEDGTAYDVCVTNNGALPEKDIVEGGGLSTLRHRVERAGGTMRVDARPKFALHVALPKRKEEMG